MAAGDDSKRSSRAGRTRGAAATLDAALRAKLMMVAEQLLDRHGPDGLSIRELARECGVSTMGIYTLFGGRPGVMQALYAEGFVRLHAHALSAEQRDDPALWLIGQMAAYRRFAINNVGMYRLMFGGQRRFVPADRNSRFAGLTVPVTDAYPSFAALVDAVAACGGGAGEGAPAAEDVAFAVWAHLHGLVGLEIAGYVAEEQAAARFAGAARMLMCGQFGFAPAHVDERLQRVM